MAMRLLSIHLVCLAALSGCAHSIADIDVSKVEPNCTRQCTGTYSSCVSGGNQVGFKTETLRACRDAYEVCIKTCPAK
jgi:hypothetical protein